METEADTVAEPDGTGMEGIVAEQNAMATDQEVGPENAVAGPQPDATETKNVNATAEGGGGVQLTAPVG